MLPNKISLYVRPKTKKFSIMDVKINFLIVPGFEISPNEHIHDITYHAGKSTKLPTY